MSNLNLSEDIQHFIDLNFTYDKKIEVYQIVGMLNKFDNKFYEDKLLDTIIRDDTLDNMSKVDLFINNLNKELLDIINTHGITLFEDSNPSTSDLLNIADTLYLIQNLEDYRYIEIIIFSNLDSKTILAELTDWLTLLSKNSFLELVESVDSSLIESIRLMIEDKGSGNEVLDKKHREYVKTFFEFINKTDCLGIKYYFLGYNNLNLENLIYSIDLDIITYVDVNILSSRAQTALDVLSLLIITNDLYEAPVLKFKKKAYLFTNKPEHVTILEKVITEICGDFSLYLEAKKEAEKHGQTRIS